MAAPAAAKPNSSTGQRPGLDRTAKALDLHRINMARSRHALTADPRNITVDQGNVSVMQDDGTLILPFNAFDLANKSVTFTPQGNNYAVQSGAGVFDAGTGATSTALSLDDDDSSVLTFPAPFTFFGVSYDSAYINTDGNLTFVQPDTASTERSLSRIVKGAPRISPLFDDLLPGFGASITVQKLGDRTIIDWLSISEYGLRSRNTFQVVLRTNGVIQFNYQTINVSGAVVSLSPGSGATPSILDFSQQTLPTSVPGTISEVFSTFEQIDLAAISEAFLETHKDAYDSIIVFSDFSLDLQSAFAYEIPVRNRIDGIMPDFGKFDFGTDFGSTDRLLSMVNGGSLSQYPTDPQALIPGLGTNNTLEVLGQEFGHTWLAFVDTNPSAMLGRDQAHWSFFMNTEGSVMEGNQIQDMGGGLFQTTGATFRYSLLDQYIMGLRPASEVQPWFVVTNPTLVSAPADFTCRPINPACGPAIGVQMRGTRRDLTIQDVIAIAGPRVPGSDTAQKDFSVGFVLLTKRGQEANPKSVAHVEDIRQQWETFFSKAVDSRGTMTTKLVPIRPTTTSQLNLTLPTNGSTTLETASGNELRVGYGSVQSAFGVAILRSFSSTDLVSEAGVPATVAAMKWTMYAEKATSLSTGVAIANPNSAPANLTLRLSNGAQTTLQVPARGQHAAFVDEFFQGLEPFLGTLTVQSDVPIAVLALRGTQNAFNQFVMSTIPISSSDPSTGGISAFPMIADGGGYNTEMVLVNSGTAVSTGTIQFSVEVATSEGTASRFPFSIPAGGVWKLRTLGNGDFTLTGSATMNVDSSAPMPDGTAIIRFSSAAGLLSETGVPAQALLTHGIFFGAFDSSLRTGIALQNPSPLSVPVQLTARDGNGTVVGTATVVLQASSRTSQFLNELMPGLPANFTGTVSMDASGGVYAIALRGTTLKNQVFLMAAMPILDTARSAPSPQYFPQIAVGGSYTTQFLISSTGSSAIQLSFMSTTGDPLALPLP
jgi:hypothetical protein